ncbi:hypothetical protein [Pseudomonas syringae]|uniref:NAD(P)-binding domain-containing protein n=1 Tax=Pseudomonas syringae pv. syringae TaxID=321 RepID=A0AAE5S3E8_PSESY|nr:hypothetical protein [Pseudomonas syringae]POQ00758.1 hypothetical protein CXB42_25355 [Pseudomonas syringae pv. syringae]
MSTLLIYGATGNAGRMAAERARALGLNVEVAALAVFLASQDSHWVTGESIRASGAVRGVGY